MGSGPQARLAHCDGPQQLPPCWYRCPYRCVRVMGEWCPPGVILWSLIYFQADVRRGCGIQRIPGDKVTVEKKNIYIYIYSRLYIYPRVRLFRGGCYSTGVCYHPCYKVVCCTRYAFICHHATFKSFVPVLTKSIINSAHTPLLRTHVLIMQPLPFYATAVQVQNVYDT